MCCEHRCSRREPQSGARHAASVAELLRPRRSRSRDRVLQARAATAGAAGCARRRAVGRDRAVQPAEGHGGVREVLRGAARAARRGACAGDRVHARRLRAVLAHARGEAGAHLPGSGPALGLEGGEGQGYGRCRVQDGGRGHPELRDRRGHGAAGAEDQLTAVRVAILAARQGGGWHTDQLCRALAGRGHEGRVLPYEALVAHLGGAGTASGVAAAGEDIGGGAAVLARIIPPGSLRQIVFRGDARATLGERGIPVVNPPRTIERTVDKLWTTALLEQAGPRVAGTGGGEGGGG